MTPTAALPPIPAARATVEILRQKGHTVAVRRNRNGSWRYAVDGAPETDALTMSNRFRHYGV